MTRIAVFRFQSAFDPKPVNVNDEIGLDPFVDYTLQQHLDDLASEGRKLKASAGNTYQFEDGTLMYLKQVEEEVDRQRLNLETLYVLRSDLAALESATA